MVTFLWFLAFFFDSLGAFGIVCCILIVLCLLYLSFNNYFEFFCLTLYSVCCFGTIYCILFYFASTLLNVFLNPILEPLIVGDPTDFTYTYFSFIFFLSILFTIPFFFLVSFFYVVSIYSLNTFRLLSILYGLFLYDLVVLFCIVKYDLFFSNWSSIADLEQFNLTFDFQPGFETIILSFCMEFWEFSWFTFLFVFLPFLLFLLGNSIFVEVSLFWVYIVFSLYYLYAIYLFFEFSFINNSVIGAILFIAVHSFWILWRIFEKCKQFKE